MAHKNAHNKFVSAEETEILEEKVRNIMTRNSQECIQRSIKESPGSVRIRAFCYLVESLAFLIVASIASLST